MAYDNGFVRFIDAPLCLIQFLHDNVLDIMATESVDKIYHWVESGEVMYFNEMYFPEPYRSNPIYNGPYAPWRNSVLL